MSVAKNLKITPQQIHDLPQIVSPLLAWFEENARPMPWRDNPDPYYVWVSEIMLQQTRVDTVRPYFQRFITAFPTVEALASAPLEQVLKLWEGLGYYNRARYLHRAAKKISSDFGGQLPPDYDGLKTLPGIGDYTAGAIASLAFGLPAPAVDGNVYRVLTRVLASSANTSRAAVQQSFRQLVARMIPPHRPGDFNQSLMELGALVCRPHGFPHCPRCPISSFCLAAEQPWATDLPVKNPPKNRKKQRRTLLFVQQQDHLLLVQRPTTGLLAGLWEPINIKGRLTQAEVEDYLHSHGATLKEIVAIPPSTHIFSHLEWEMEGWQVTTSGFPQLPHSQWVTETETYPLPRAFSAYSSLLRKK